MEYSREILKGKGIYDLINCANQPQLQFLPNYRYQNKCKGLHINISNNFINLCGGHAIGYTADYVTVSNNKFFNIRWNGIYHFGGLVGNISANTFKDTGKESERYSIQVGGNGATESKGVVVNGNSVANLNGIKVNGNASKILVTNNVAIITNEISDGCSLANNIQL